MRQTTNVWQIILSAGLVILLTVDVSSAQIFGRILGQVTCEKNQKALPGANVQIENTFLGASCDGSGNFVIPKVAPGQYTLKISFIGCSTEKVRVTVEPRKDTIVNVNLTPSPIQFDQIIVTGSRQPEELASATSSISVIDNVEINRRNRMRIDEALTSVSGVAIVGENINIRGGSGYNRLGGGRVLVMLDEVPILTSDLGVANWDIIPVTEVERIEVLKGAASSLYGSGGLSGVVNIFTRQPGSGHNFSVRQMSGIFDSPSVPEWKWTDKKLYYNRTDLSYGNTFGPLGVRLALSHHTSTGDRENGDFNRWYLTGKAKYRFPDASILTLFSTYSHDTRSLFLQWKEQNAALQVPPPDRGNRYELDGVLAYAVYHKLFSPTLSTKIRLSYNQQLVGIPFNLTSDFSPALGLSGEIQANWKPHPDHSISTGIDYKRDEVESKYYGKQQANAVSPYIQEIWKISQIWQLNAGLRWDTYTLVGDSVETQLSPRLGGSYQPFHGTIIHFSWGRGFRAASVVERFIEAESSSGDFRALPNPTLQPERSTLIDIGMRQRFGKAFFTEVVLFSNTYRNFIEPTLSSDFSAQFLNYPRARIQGVETEVKWRFWKDRLGIQASATWMDPKELESGEPLLYRPRFIAFFSPSITLGPFSLEADYQHASIVQKVAVYPLDERVPKNVWDVRLSYRWNNITVQAIVKNTINYNYTISERVLGEIRNFAIAVRGEF